MNEVKGCIKNKEFDLDRISRRLKTLGYQVHGQDFKKSGKIEAIINELVPLVEEQGANVFGELYLEEHKAPGQLIAKYDNGKVERYD